MSVIKCFSVFLYWKFVGRGKRRWEGRQTELRSGYFEQHAVDISDAARVRSAGLLKLGVAAVSSECYGCE
jgi:hypothetical protein